MPRIIVHTSEPSSGAARYVSELISGLVANKANVTLFCPPTFDYLANVKACGVSVAFASRRSLGRGGFLARVLRNTRFLFGTARRQIQETRSGDIVHVQFPLHFPAGLAFFALARLRRCGIVFTVHDPVPHKCLLPRRLRSLELTMLRWAYCLSNKLIVHNEIGKKILIDQFRQHPGKIVVIPHGPLVVSQGIEEAAAGELRLLIFGGIRENKGVHLAIQAVQSINSRNADPVQLTIAGEVANAREQSYWDHCRRLIERNPTGIRVMDRYISDSETGTLIAAHHALLLPYREFTSESGVAALALANRRPIIATREGGLGAILAQGRCGIPIEGNTVEAIIEAIAKAREADPETLRKMGEAGAAFMEAGRSWNEIGRRTLAVYSDIRGASGICGTTAGAVN